MDWQQILLAIIGIIVTSLVSWLVERVIVFINSKIQNNKNANILSNIVRIIGDAVKATYQTYAQALKDKDMFDKDAQINALNQAIDKIESKLTCDMKDFIAKNFGDANAWIKDMIESIIYDLKNKPKPEVAEK